MPAITNSTAAFFQRSLGQFGDLRALAEKLQGQIASGERLSRSSEDPVASSRLRSLSRIDRLAQIDSANASRVTEELSAGAASVQSFADLMARARELTVMAASDATGQNERDLIASEIDQLCEALFSAANGFSSTGRSLFGGNIGGSAYEIDGTGVVTYVGSGGSGTIDIGEGVAIERGLTGPGVLSFDNGGAQTDGFAFLAALTDGMRNAADPAAASRDSLAGFDAAIDQIGRAQAIYGARLAWVETVEQAATLRAESRAEEGGEIGGTDLAQAITRLQQTLTVLEASQASFARVSSLTLFDTI